MIILGDFDEEYVLVKTVSYLGKQYMYV